MEDKEFNVLLSEAIRLVLEEKRGKKIHRDAFLYLSPKGDKENFAQCSTCRLWTGKTCLLMGKHKVTGDMSCGLYWHGEPQKDMVGKEINAVSPLEAGLVKRKVRCENCRSFDEKRSSCLLFESLNKAMPDKFDLDEKVNAYGCCNAQMAK